MNNKYVSSNNKPLSYNNKVVSSNVNNGNNNLKRKTIQEDVEMNQEYEITNQENENQSSFKKISTETNNISINEISKSEILKDVQQDINQLQEEQQQLLQEIIQIKKNVGMRKLSEIALLSSIQVPLHAIKQKSIDKNGKKCDYVSASYVIQTMNEIFGIAGWKETYTVSEAIISEISRDNYQVNYSCNMSIVVNTSDGYKIEHSNYGCSIMTGKNLLEVKSKCYKSCISDGIKRVAKLFGCAFGLMLNNNIK